MMNAILRALMVVAMAGILAPLAAAAEQEAPLVKVWKHPSCGCCGKWVEHMRASGFRIKVKAVQNLTPIKRMAGIPDKLRSCHTAIVDGYRIEGHVPAEDVKRLLKTRPKVHGLAVPGMPVGSPGMEGSTTERYDVVTFTQDGKTTVFARH